MIVTFDPGETTGYALFSENCTLLEAGTFPMWDRTPELINKNNVLLIIVEEFVLYPWKAKQQSFSSFPTVEVIGVIKYLAQLKNIEVTVSPTRHKTEFPDPLMKKIGYYVSNKHSRDAIRHGLYHFKHQRHSVLIDKLFEAAR